jgi:hypothetical protein
VLISVTERETTHLGKRFPCTSAIFDPFKRALSEAHLEVLECRPASANDAEQLGSTWAKRLGIPRRRPAWLLTARRYP